MATGSSISSRRADQTSCGSGRATGPLCSPPTFAKTCMGMSFTAMEASAPAQGRAAAPASCTGSHATAKMAPILRSRTPITTTPWRSATWCAETHHPTLRRRPARPSAMAPAPPFLAHSHASSVQDNDGDLDIVLGGSKTWLLLNPRISDGGNTWAHDPDFPTDAPASALVHAVALGDVDNDGTAHDRTWPRIHTRSQPRPVPCLLPRQATWTSSSASAARLRTRAAAPAAAMPLFAGSKVLPVLTCRISSSSTP